MRVAFIGLGNMGKPMSRNLITAGHAVHGFDISPDACACLVQQGGTAAASAADAVRNVDLVISMLPTGEHVRDLYFGAGDIVAHLSPGTLLMDSSTISISVTRDLAARVKASGFAVIDAPVSGGTMGAEAGTLTFMIGGEKADMERAIPALRAMGKNLVHAGASGAGQAAKICNNMLSGICMIGTTEALALGIANGLDPAVLSEIMRTSSGTNFALQKLNPYPGTMEGVPSARGYTGGFRTDFQLKDMLLATQLATESRTVAILGQVACNLFAVHSANGYAASDYSSIMAMMHPALAEQVKKDG